ncbi:hypothetical protein JCM3766R1_000175 [Sporobolomyces carnicolor]
MTLAIYTSMKRLRSSPHSKSTSHSPRSPSPPPPPLLPPPPQPATSVPALLPASPCSNQLRSHPSKVGYRELARPLSDNHHELDSEFDEDDDDGTLDGSSIDDSYFVFPLEPLEPESGATFSNATQRIPLSLEVKISLTLSLSLSNTCGARFVDSLSPAAADGAFCSPTESPVELRVVGRDVASRVDSVEFVFVQLEHPHEPRLERDGIFGIGEDSAEEEEGNEAANERPGRAKVRDVDARQFEPRRPSCASGYASTKVVGRPPLQPLLIPPSLSPLAPAGPPAIGRPHVRSPSAPATSRRREPQPIHTFTPPPPLVPPSSSTFASFSPSSSKHDGRARAGILRRATSSSKSSHRLSRTTPNVHVPKMQASPPREAVSPSRPLPLVEPASSPRGVVVVDSCPSPPSSIYPLTPPLSPTLSSSTESTSTGYSTEPLVRSPVRSPSTSFSYSCSPSPSSSLLSSPSAWIDPARSFENYSMSSPPPRLTPHRRAATVSFGDSSVSPLDTKTTTSYFGLGLTTMTTTTTSTVGGDDDNVQTAPLRPPASRRLSTGVSRSSGPASGASSPASPGGGGGTTSAAAAAGARASAPPVSLNRYRHSHFRSYSEGYPSAAAAAPRHRFELLSSPLHHGCYGGGGGGGGGATTTTTTTTSFRTRSRSTNSPEPSIPEDRDVATDHDQAQRVNLILTTSAVCLLT